MTKVDTFLAAGDALEADELARGAHRLGFDGLFTAETSHDPFLPIAVAATATTDLDYGTAIAVAFARSPMVTAMTAWDLSAATRGRFLLGLGTQIKAHITRRFSMEWGSPGPRLREYIEAVRGIWDTWQNGTPLRFEGEFYRHTLSTPFFEPEPLDHAAPPIYIAGVGPYMAKVAGQVCDGIHVHAFHTIDYVDSVIRPHVAEGAASRGRSPDDVTLATSIMVATGASADEIALNRRAVAQQIAFYASTPAYSRVLDLHGWDMGRELTRLSVQGEWAAMADLIPDEMIDAMSITGPVDEIGARVRDRCGDRFGRISLYALDRPLPISSEQWPGVIAALKG